MMVVSYNYPFLVTNGRDDVSSGSSDVDFKSIWSSYEEGNKVKKPKKWKLPKVIVICQKCCLHKDVTLYQCSETGFYYVCLNCKLETEKYVNL